MSAGRRRPSPRSFSLEAQPWAQGPEPESSVSPGRPVVARLAGDAWSVPFRKNASLNPFPGQSRGGTEASVPCRKRGPAPAGPAAADCLRETRGRLLRYAGAAAVTVTVTVTRLARSARGGSGDAGSRLSVQTALPRFPATRLCGWEKNSFVQAVAVPLHVEVWSV